MRKNVLRFGYVLIILGSLVLVNSCKNSNKDDGKETIIKGKTTILVDETFQPLIEDQVAVFQSKYKAEITIQGKSENELVQSLLKDTTRIVVLSRVLSANENKYFEQLKIKPKVTPIGKDAIALISNKGNNDTLVALDDVISFMHGKEVKGLKGLVFDNPNSSTVRYMNQLAGLTSLPAKNVYSFKTNEEVVKFIAENEGMIGFVGLNYLYQPTKTVANNLKNINVLSVKDSKKKDYFAPSQNNLAEGTYPLARDLYIINCQGYSGLGMGFASFVAGDIGQRIILKSGLLPIRTTGRKINFITNKKKENENE